MGPYSFSVKENYQVERLIATDFCTADLDLRSGSTDVYQDFVQNIERKLIKNEKQALISSIQRHLLFSTYYLLGCSLILDLRALPFSVISQRF